MLECDLEAAEEKINKKKCKKSSYSSDTGETNDGGIKTRLRRNSNSGIPKLSSPKASKTPKTPHKSGKENTPSKNPKLIKKLYEAEGKMMQSFLGKPNSNTVATEFSNNETGSESETEVSLGKHCGDDSQFVQMALTPREEASGSAKSTPTPDTSHRGMNALTDVPNIRGVNPSIAAESLQLARKGKQQSCEEMATEREIEILKEKISSLDDGSMERMILEMRLDMKQDNLKMMVKIDKVTTSTSNLQREVKQIRNEQKSLDQRLQFTQDAQAMEQTRVNEISLQTFEMQEKIRILQGEVGKQNQWWYLSRCDKDEAQEWELRNNLLISGLDEEDREMETTTAKLVTDFFSQTMKITEPIALKRATRIGKAAPRVILAKLEKVRAAIKTIRASTPQKLVARTKIH